MHGSDPLDHDPTAKVITFRDLICAAGNGSDGQDKRKRGAAAGLAGAELPRRSSVGVRHFRPSGGQIDPDLGLGWTSRYA